METLKYDNLIVEIFADETYTLGSADNVNTYNYVYSTCDSINKDYDRSAPKYGIVVKDEERVLSSAIVIAGGGGMTSPHSKCALIDGANLIIIIGDSIFSLSLPGLALNWKTECGDCVTCFGLYKVDDAYIVHGEVSILKIIKSGQIEWEFFGRDIFTTAEGKDDFQIKYNLIIAMDWEYNAYKIDLNGKEIK